MANTVPIYQRRVVLPTGDDARYAKLYISTSGTNTAVDTFSDVALEVQQSRPVVADAWGVFPATYVAAGATLRILITDENDVALPGYPQDNIVPISADAQGAADVIFSPTEALPFTNTQAAIEGAAALSTDQLANSERSLTPWTTGGSGDDFTIEPDPAITAYGTYQVFTIRPNRASTGAATLNVNGLGARELVGIGSNLSNRPIVAGEIQPGRHFMAFYDGTRFYVTLGRGYSAVVQDFLFSPTQAAMQTSLGVAVGTQVQAYSDKLTDIAALTPTNSYFIVGNGSTWQREAGSTVRTSLGLGSVATLDATDMGDLTMRVADVNEVRADDGSASDPSFTFRSDDNSGMYSISNGIYAFSSNSSERLRISSQVTVTGTLNVGTVSGSGEGVRGQTPGAVGTYAFAATVTAGSYVFGDSIAGSSLSPSDTSTNGSALRLTGTWVCMGRLSSTGQATLWYRES